MFQFKHVHLEGRSVVLYHSNSHAKVLQLHLYMYRTPCSVLYIDLHQRERERGERDRERGLLSKNTPDLLNDRYNKQYYTIATFAFRKQSQE